MLRVASMGLLKRSQRSLIPLVSGMTVQKRTFSSPKTPLEEYNAAMKAKLDKTAGNPDELSAKQYENTEDWSWKRIAGAIFFGTGAFVTAGLCIWQIRRRTWKQNLLEYREQQMNQPAVDMDDLLTKQCVQLHDKAGPVQEKPLTLDGVLSSLQNFKEQVQFRQVRLSGTFDYSKEQLVGMQAPPLDVRNVHKSDNKRGYYILTPLTLDEPLVLSVPIVDKQTGAVLPAEITVKQVLVNRGWINANAVLSYINNRIAEPLFDESGVKATEAAIREAGSSKRFVFDATQKRIVPLNPDEPSAAVTTTTTSTSSWWPSWLSGSGKKQEEEQQSDNFKSVVKGLLWFGQPAPTGEFPVIDIKGSGIPGFQFAHGATLSLAMGISPTILTLPGADPLSIGAADPTDRHALAVEKAMPVFMVDSFDPAPAKRVEAVDQEMRAGGSFRLTLLRKTTADYNKFHSTPTTHAAYAFTWGSLCLALSYITIAKFIRSGSNKDMITIRRFLSNPVVKESMKK